MALRAGDEPIVPTGRVPMLSSDNKKVDWFMQTIKMTAFFKRRAGAEAVWKLKVPAGTAAQTLAFKKLHEVLNNFCFSVLVEMCNDNETAMMQVRSLFVSDPDHWANSLWVALETRFTQETLSQLQNNLINLSQFTADLSSESFKQMVDRFRKLISDVRAIDAAQVPSDTNLLAVLKESIVTVEGLWSQLEFNTPNITLDIAMDIISRWRTAKQSSGVKTRSETVANFRSMPPSPNWKKKA